MRKAYWQPDGSYKDGNGEVIKRQPSKYLEIGDQWQDAGGKFHEITHKETDANGGIIIISRSVPGGV